MTGRITTVAGDGKRGFGGVGFPSAVAVDGAGRVFVAATGSSVVRRIEADGKIGTVAAGDDLRGPEGVAVALHA